MNNILFDWSLISAKKLQNEMFLDQFFGSVWLVLKQFLLIGQTVSIRNNLVAAYCNSLILARFLLSFLWKLGVCPRI